MTGRNASAETEAPQKWLERMCSELSTYGSYKADEQEEAYMRLFKTLAQLFGRKKAELGIMTALNDKNRPNRDFPPSRGDFFEYVEKADPNYRPKLGAAKVDCKTCDGTGWRPVGEGKDRRVTPCDCRKL